MTLFDAVIISIVEGLTEFLPISSTGHMILASSFMGIENSAFLKTFEIAIQVGAIAAIVIMYAKRFLKGVEIYIKLSVAFIPTAVIGFAAYKFIKQYLFSPTVVSLSLIVGGVILILVDKYIITKKSQYLQAEDISLKNSFFIGLVQCISMIPGVSRAGATILGGIFNGLDKKQATEFSFLLAVPTMLAAAGYDILKNRAAFTTDEVSLLSVGLITAFISAWIAVKIFIKIVEKYGFKYFGWYRIGIGLLSLILLQLDIIK